MKLVEPLSRPFGVNRVGMKGQKLLPCLALFLGRAQARQSKGPPQASFLGQRTTRILIQVAREETECMRRIGAAIEQEATEQHPAVLRNQVTSPGGTTAEGLLIMERMGVRAAIVEAVEAAWRKSMLLGAGGER